MKQIAVMICLLLGVAGAAEAQRLIEYQAGMGSRDPKNGDVWILYHHVRATHDGIILEADSAHYDTRQNSFTAFRNVNIQITDTTFIYGDRLYYDGNSRVVDIWADTVVLLDGATQLLANHLTYDRNRATAYYTEWGYGDSEGRNLYSQQGQYNSDLKQFYVYHDVQLWDSTMSLFTDTLLYNTETELAHFESPTRIYTDSATLYSSLGEYNTASGNAISYRHSRVQSKGRMIDCDTLLYEDASDYGQAIGHVVLHDSANDLTCTGLYCETSQADRYTLLTGEALALFVDEGDSLFLHADTIYVTNDTARQVQTVRAAHHVKAFRHDAQAMCDSAFYSAVDSTLWLHGEPTLWQDHYQCTADTIELRFDSSGTRRVYLRSKVMALQQVDREKFNQLKGNQGVIYFVNGEPRYADIVGNAMMVFYITEQDSAGKDCLMGCNAGLGSSIRIYVDTTRQPERVVTHDNPDMKTYPVGEVPDEWRRLKGFQWLSARRPRGPKEVFLW